MKIQKYEFIELVIPANTTSTRFTFTDQPQLRFVSMLGLNCYNDQTITKSILSGNTNITQAIMNTGFLVLYYDDKESTNRIPLTLLNPVQSNGSTNAPGQFSNVTFGGQQVQWSKSYIVFTAAPPVGSVNYSVCFGVYYS